MLVKKIFAVLLILGFAGGVYWGINSSLLYFPFDFSVIPNSAIANIMPVLMTVVLIIVMVGIGIGTFVMFIQMIINMVKS